MSTLSPYQGGAKIFQHKTCCRNAGAKKLVEVRRNSEKTLHQATLQGLDQRSKMEEVVPKMARQRNSNAIQFRKRWVRCYKWCPQALQEEFSFFCILHWYIREQKKAVTVEAKSGQFTTSKTGKGQSLWGNRKNLAEERVERKVLSSGSIAGMPYLCNDRDQWAGNMGEEECRSSFGERVCQFVTGKSSVIGDPLKS